MTDVHTPALRSKNMRAIRSKNTQPEILIRKLLFASGFRFRLHVNTLPGAPDIVLPKHKVAIFVHGCFWHGHNCPLFRLPQTRQEFWQTKIGLNRDRDLRDVGALQSAGWRVLVVWECALKGRGRREAADLRDRLSDWIRGETDSPAFGEVRHQ